jgi:hypothetical protein
VFNHSAIVLKWPRCIHALKDGGVQEFNIDRHPMWAGHEVKIFDPFPQEMTDRLRDAR